MATATKSLFRDVDLSGFGFSGVSHVGHGHSASAQLVRDDETGQIFVAKCVSLAALTEHDQVFAHQEVFLLQALRHPLIVAYHDSFLIEGTNILVIVMEYCDGGDLRKLINQKAESGGYFTEDEVMTWFAQIVLALQYIHSEKVLHRDLKTSNIFLSKESLVVKLGDFGISRVLEGTADAAVTMVGTPYYMSPEVCRNESYSWKSDVWSLGCVLYELCMLKHAFESASLLGLVYKIVSDHYDPIPSFYSQELNDLLRQLLSKTADARPSIDQLLANPYVRPYVDKLAPFTTAPAPAPRSSGAPVRPNASAAPAMPAVPAQAAPPPDPGTSFTMAPQTRMTILASRIRQRLVAGKQNWITSFACFDESGSGSFSPGVMRTVFASLDLRLSGEEISELVEALAPGIGGTDGKIPLASFEAKLVEANTSLEALQLGAWARSLLEPISAKVSTLMRIKDGAQSGLLVGAEFRAVLIECLPDLTEEQMDVLALLSDKTADGEVDYAHFVDSYATPRALNAPPPPWPQWLGAPPPPPPLPPGSAPAQSTGPAPPVPGWGLGEMPTNSSYVTCTNPDATIS